MKVLRACVDFYKRTTSSGKQYACRQGKGQCKLSKGSMCRRCRFDKCIELGMANPRAKKTNVDDQEPTASTSTCHTDVMATESILQRIGKAHRTFKDRCKFVELSMRSTSLREHVRVPHESEDLLLCTWSFLMDCLKMYAMEYFCLAGSCFPEFESLSLEEKYQMLKNCGTRAYILETHRLNTTILKGGEEPLLVASITYYLDRLAEILWPHFEKCELTDTEFYALFGLVVWQFDPSQEISEKLHSIAKAIRMSIYNDLDRYYREELKVDDYCARLGNLLLLECTLQEANALKSEELQTYNLLDMFTSDVSFLQLVLQIVL